MTRQRISSGTPWEGRVGYSRAVRAGNLLFVAGTTATGADGRPVAPGDPYRQTQFILERLREVLEQAGGSLENVVRTRLFVTDISQWEAVGRAHAEVFAEIRPAATMVEVSRLVDPEHMVEIEVDAVLASEPEGAPETSGKSRPSS